MNEYEQNKKKIAEYRERNNSKILKLLCNVMQWANEKCIKESEDNR